MRPNEKFWLMDARIQMGAIINLGGETRTSFFYKPQRPKAIPQVPRDGYTKTWDLGAGASGKSKPCLPANFTRWPDVIKI